VQPPFFFFFFFKVTRFSGCWSDTGGNGSMVTGDAKVVCHSMFKIAKAVTKNTFTPRSVWRFACRG
jgi:hypothetical protein